MDTERLDHSRVLQMLPDRRPDTHKGDYGKLLLLCGSRGFTGAAALAARGALRAGAGLVYLGVPRSIYSIEAVKLTEPVIFPLPDLAGAFGPGAARKVKRRLPGMDAVLIGPGMGKTRGCLGLLRCVLREARCPVILDADGINLLAAHRDILRGSGCPLILTPHEGEYARLAGPVGPDKRKAAERLAREMSCVVLLKGHQTVITDGDRTYVNPTGNPGMAVGGSGDLLAGIITALIGQGLPPLEAAACGAWLHGAAGDLCAGELGMYAMLPEDMLQALPRLLK